MDPLLVNLGIIVALIVVGTVLVVKVALDAFRKWTDYVRKVKLHRFTQEEELVAEFIGELALQLSKKEHVSLELKHFLEARAFYERVVKRLGIKPVEHPELLKLALAATEE